MATSAGRFNPFAHGAKTPWDRSAVGSVVGASTPKGARAKRKPSSLLRFVGWFLLRFAVRQFAAGLFQLPPRFTRFEPQDRSPPPVVARRSEISSYGRRPLV